MAVILRYSLFFYMLLEHPASCGGRQVHSCSLRLWTGSQSTRSPVRPLVQVLFIYYQGRAIEQMGGGGGGGGCF